MPGLTPPRASTARVPLRAVQPQGHAIGAAAGKDERREIDFGDAITQRGQASDAQESGAFAITIWCADIDGIDAEGRGVLIGRLDAVFEAATWAWIAARAVGREGWRIIKQPAAAKRAEAGVEVIEAVGRKLESNHGCPNASSITGSEFAVERWPWPAQKKPRSCVPDAVARAFLQHAVRQFDHFVQQAARLEVQECGAEYRLLALPLGMAKAGQRARAPSSTMAALAGKDQVGKAGNCRDSLDAGAVLFRALRSAAALASAADLRPAGRRCQASGRIQGLI